jgi:acetyltransferase-like isoleucine patch superfamily enzyme
MLISKLSKKIRSHFLRNRFNSKKHCQIYRNVRIDKETSLGGYDRIAPFTNVEGSSIGLCTIINASCYLKETIIGSFTSIGSSVNVVEYSHPSKTFVSTSSSFYISEYPSPMQLGNSVYKEKLSINQKTSVIIGNDVWIGNDVLIRGGITIGDGAIIGMGCVVTKDVPPYAVVVGNPMKIIRYRFSEQQIRQLMEIKWWEHPIEQLKAVGCSFKNIDEFLATVSLENKK